jgi:hypothetical protein
VKAALIAAGERVTAMTAAAVRRKERQLEKSTESSCESKSCEKRGNLEVDGVKL